MKRTYCTLTICSALAACGGGGGGGTITAANDSNNALVGAVVALSASNFEPAATEIVGSTSGMRSTGSPAQSLLSGAEVTPLVTPSLILEGKLSQLAQLLKKQPHLTGAVVSESLPCDQGGKMDVSINDMNSNEELDPGDSAEITFSDCRLNNTKMNGAMSFTVTSGSSNSYLAASNISILTTLQNMKLEFNDIMSISNGSFTMRINSVNSTTLTVDMLSPRMTNQVTQAGKTKVFQYTDYSINTITDRTTTSWAVKGTVSVPTLGANTAYIDTTTRFSQPNSLGFATTGQLLISVSQGGKMRVSATGTSNARIELDLNEDGTYEEFRMIPWMSIL